MLDRALVEQFFTILNSNDLINESSDDFAKRNERVNRTAFPILATHPELAHARLSDFVKDARDDSPLHAAAFYFNLDLIRRLIALGADVNVETRFGNSVLWTAIRVDLTSTDAYQQAKLQTIELLLELGADPNRKYNSGETLLHAAVQRSNDALYATIVGLLLRCGCDPNAVSLKGWAPIHMWRCNREALELMIAHGANINLPTKHGSTVLMRSFIQGCGDVAVLLNYGADVHARDKKRLTALHYFAIGDGREGDLQQLLQAGSPVDARDSRGYTPLHYAACYGRLANVRLLLSAGADIEARSHLQETPLAVVKMGKSLAGAEPYNDTPCNEAEYAAMEALLEELGAKPVEVKSTRRRTREEPVEATDTNATETATAEAITEVEADRRAGERDAKAWRVEWRRNPLPDTMLDLFYKGLPEAWNEVQELLAAHPGLAKARFYNLSTPLHWAASAVHPGLVTQCLALGADVNLRDSGGNTPLMFALMQAKAVFQEGRHRLDVIEKLLTAGANPNRDNGSKIPLHSVLYYASSPIFLPLLQMLLSAGSDPNWQSSNYMSPMYDLCEFPAAISLLAEYGGDVNITGSEGDTPLLNCVRSSGDPAAIRTLLDLGAKVDHRNRQGHCALHYAALVVLEGHLVKLLLEGGANPNLKDRRGYTPLHGAASVCALENIHLLLARGADINATSKKGETPLSIAQKGENVMKHIVDCDIPPTAKDYAETAALLRQAGALQ